MKDNVNKTNWGYEVTWAKQENYVGKMLVFPKAHSCTDLHLYRKAKRTWFVNTGNFKIRWTDTKDAKIYENDLKEGQVFHCDAMKPVQIYALSDDSSITEVSDGTNEKEDFFKILSAETLGKPNVE